MVVLCAYKVTRLCDPIDSDCIAIVSDNLHYIDKKEANQ